MKANCYSTLLFFVLSFFLSFTSSYAHNKPGKIIRLAPVGTARTTLDPNGDDFVSATTVGFPVNDDVTTSAINYKPIVPYNMEPYGDLRRGPNPFVGEVELQLTLAQKANVKVLLLDEKRPAGSFQTSYSGNGPSICKVITIAPFTSRHVPVTNQHRRSGITAKAGQTEKLSK